jgi:hypothetical protein
VFQSLGKDRLRVHGILNLQGNGSVLIATNAATAEDRKNVCWASDRQVHFLNGDDAAKIVRLLHHGDVAAVTINGADPAGFEKIQSQLHREVAILPVHAGHNEIKFGTPLPPDAGIDAVRAGIAKASESQEH